MPSYRFGMFSTLLTHDSHLSFNIPFQSFASSLDCSLSFSELASSSRAVCNVTEHKKAGVKIGKGELRMGAWVDFGETGSWKWRHW